MLRDYKELKVWKKAYRLVLEVYKATDTFPKTELYGLTSQMRRASLSIPSNIAEGYRRTHMAEYLQFLSMAMGSAAELETQWMLAKDLGYVNEAVYASVYSNIGEVIKMITGLMNSLKKEAGKVKIAAVLLFLALTLPSTLSPLPCLASGAGTTAAPFLKVAMSPRAIAMGGAFSALADDSGAVFVNPAGLAQFDKQEVGLGFTSYFQDAKMGNLSYAGNLADKRFGLGATFMNVGGIERRGASDALGTVPELGAFSSNDLAVSLAYAKKDAFPNFLDKLDAGFGLKFIRSAIDTDSAFALAVDAGVIYHASERVNFSMALANLGSKMKFDSESDPLPFSLRAGMLYKPQPRLNFVAELNQYFVDEKFYPSAGAEYWFRDSFALRGGYKFGYDSANLGLEVGLSLGFGLKVSGLGVDYAYLPFGDLGNVHRFGFWMQF
ncbi:MAG: PorV/PorQ family protein [Elusimicrobia bacterium]|nr:PorV/PorQ family protein [Elusimicrobiota bacterium]